MIAPAVLNIPERSAALFYILGPIIAAVAMISMSESVRNFRLVNVAAGAVLAVSPVFLNLQPTGNWNNIIIGALTIGAALVRGRVKNRFGGGWRSLFAKNPAHLGSGRTA